MSYTYAQLESVMVRVFDVPDDEIGAFRARIRRLRDLGIPSVPRIGSGSRNKYETENMIELAIALAMLSVGVASKYIKDGVELSLEKIRNDNNKFLGHLVDRDIYLHIANEGKFISAETSYTNIGSIVKTPQSIIPVSVIVRKIEEALG